MKRKISRLFAGVSVTAVMISSSVVNVAAAQPVIVQDQTIAQTDGLTFDSARQSNVAFAQPFEQIPSVIAMRLRIEPGNASRQVLLGNYVYGQNCFSVELTADQQLRYVEYAYDKGAIVSGVDMKTASSKVISGELVNLAIIKDVETQSVSIACDGEIIDTLQLDGSGTNVLKENVPLSEAHYIGTDSRHQYWFDGSVANISLWDETMSASAINEAINDGLDGNEDGLTHAYVLDEAVLSTADPQIDDLCGSGIYGTVSGFDLAYAPADMLPFRSAQKSQVAFEQAFAHIPDTIAMQVRVEPGNDVRQVLMGNYVLGENCFSVELTADQQLRYVEYVYEDGAIVTAIDMRADVPKLISGKWVNLAVIRDV